MTTYIYSVANDTAQGKMFIPTLEAEIAASTITVALDGTTRDGDVLTIQFKASLTTAEKTTLDGVVAAHNGEIDSDALNLAIKGVQFDAVLNTDTGHDINFAEYRELSGAGGEVENFTKGDWVELYVVHPVDGVLGQYGETVYIKPSGKIDWIRSEGKRVQLPAGLILRAKYHSVATTGPAPEVYIDYRTHK